MKRWLLSLLICAFMVGAFMTPTLAQSPEQCFGENKRICFGEDQSGNAYIKLKNKNDFGVYFWVNPDIGGYTGSGGVDSSYNWSNNADQNDKLHLNNRRMLLIAHTHAVDFGAAYPYQQYGIPNLTRQHGIEMSVTHECETSGC